MADTTMVGQPTRNATQDANEGIINPPSKKQSATQYATTQKEQSQLSVGLDNIGNSLGNAVTQMLSQEAEQINNRRAIEAATRQGQSKALNAVDKANKRTGWTKAIFGQNVEYRAAQQRAATNSVNDSYLKELSTIDEYAGSSPEEYTKRLNEALNSNLDLYKDDVDTQQLVKAKWLEVSEKLAAKQYQSHYAYNQEQQRATYQQEVEQIFDMANMESSLVASQEDASSIVGNIRKLFNGNYKPEGMDEIANRGTINDVIMKNLRTGNIGAYNAAKMEGFFKNNTQKEQITLDRALSEYDQKFTEQVTLAWEDAQLAVADNKTYEGMIGIYQELRTQLQTLSKRSSGTPKAETALTKRERMASTGIADVEKNRAMVEEELDKFFEQGMKEARKEEAKAAEVNDLKDAMLTSNPIDRAGKLSATGASKKDQEDALDLVLLDDITRLTGSPETVTPVEATQLILGNSRVVQQVKSRLKGKGVESPMVKRATETVINGLNGLVDDKGLLNDTGKSALNNIAILEQDEDQFINMVGTDNYDKLQMIQRGMALGQNIDQVQKHIDRYTAYKGDRTKLGSDWSLISGESKRERISGLYHKFTGQYPTNDTLAHYMRDYDRALVINNEDRRSSEDYLRKSILNGATQYNGIVIQGGKKLTDGMAHSLPQLLDFAQMTKGNTPSLMTPQLQALGAVSGKDGKLSNINQIKGVTFRVIDDSLYMDSTNAQSPVRIGKDTLQSWSDGLKEQKNLQLLLKQKDDESFDKWVEEQEEFKRSAPMIAGFN